MPALRVLVVEDDPTVLETFSEALHRAGLEVEAAPTMAVALELLIRRPFQVIVADLLLPDISAFDTIAALRSVAPDSRIIVCSGVLTDELRRHARGFGAAAVLQKPVRPEQLIEAVAPGRAAQAGG
jgi:CheY-like chemotaxis protein